MIEAKLQGMLKPNVVSIKILIIISCLDHRVFAQGGCLQVETFNQRSGSLKRTPLTVGCSLNTVQGCEWCEVRTANSVQSNKVVLNEFRSLETQKFRDSEVPNQNLFRTNHKLFHSQVDVHSGGPPEVLQVTWKRKH